jgi:hypothetical protein
MARATGLEPATSGVTGRHSNQLSYARAGVIATVWRFRIAPHRLSRKRAAGYRLVGGDGLEPPTLSV